MVDGEAASEPGKKDPTKKHRHDIGAPDHGALSTNAPTKTIQVLLGLCILATIAIVIYALAV